MKFLFSCCLFVVYVFGSGSFSAMSDFPKINERKYNLGKTLFFDKNLSENGSISCASCHDIINGGDDGKPIAIGIYGKKENVNTPTVLNSRYNIAQDWIGESRTITDRTKKAFLSKEEMAGSFPKTIEYIKSNDNLYNSFRAVYGDLTEETMIDSIAYFVSNLVTPTRFDEYLNGNLDALNSEEKEGFALFKSYGCVSCHNGINIGGNMYHKLGIFNEEQLTRKDDLGRYTITKNEMDRYVFKVPTLRNIALTAPYTHNGSVKTLSDAIKIMAKFQLGRDMTDEEILKIESFLKALTGKPYYE